MREALRNRALTMAPLAYLACTMAEWAQYLGVLVDAYARSGARSAGLASLALVLPTALSAPLAGSAAVRWRPERVLLAAALVQVVAFAAAGAAAWAEAPVAVVVAFAAVGVGAIGMQRPSYAVLLPALVRSPRELSVGNVWFGWCESAAALAGPLVATALLAADGPGLVLVGCAGLSAAAVVALAGVQRAAMRDGQRAHVPERGPGLLRSVRALRSRPGALGVLSVASGQYVLIGALDLVLVVLAIDVLDLGKAGSGWLSTAVGVGALITTLLATALLRRPRLAPFLAASLATIAIGLGVLAATPSLGSALVLLPVLGGSRAIVSLCGRMLLQRSSPPQALAAVFAALELLAGICMTLGSLTAQLLIAAGSARWAIASIGAVFAVLLAVTWRSLRVADDGADVPVVAMSLLRRLPLFAPLPPFALEAVARAAVEVPVSAGTSVIVEGDVGDRYYAVVDGRFDVVMGGELMRSVSRGGDFGEVALLADVPRTATVSASVDSSVLAIDRDPFLLALTGSPSAHEAAWSRVRAMRFLTELDLPSEADLRTGR
jgi:hypothetical protein